MGRINKTFKKSKTLVDQLTKYVKILHKRRKKTRQTCKKKHEKNNKTSKDNKI